MFFQQSGRRMVHRLGRAIRFPYEGDEMDTTTIVLMVILALVFLFIGGVLGVVMAGRQRTKRLMDRFGPEYDHTINELGSKTAAEAELQSRMKHVHSLNLRPVSEEEERRFVEEWRQTQALFVDSPEEAVREADQLIKDVMIAKGYPAEDFDNRLADLSVDFPAITANYRRIKELKDDEAQDGLTTEELRQAMILCRDLFEDLLDARSTVPTRP
jgi:hypothetical protein